MTSSFDRILRWILLSVLGSLVAIFTIAGLRSYREYEQFRNREITLRQKVAEARERYESRQRFLDQLQDDPAFLEAVVRDRLGYARPDELIFRFPDDDTPLNPE